MGGGGGGTHTNVSVSQPVNPEIARKLTGGSPLALADSKIRSARSRIAGSSDSLLVSDGLFRDAEGTFRRAETACSGDSCDMSLAGSLTTQNLETLVYSDDSSRKYHAVMEHNDVKLAQGGGSRKIAGDIPYDHYGYGGWLDHSGFFAQVEKFTGGNFKDASLNSAYSVGKATGTNPVAAGGRGTWTGVMVGTDASAANREHVIQGDAGITIADFSDPKIDVAFTNIHDLNARSKRGDMTWSKIPLKDGGFKTGSNINSIEGKFYGPEHEEVGGIFERDRIVGAFGAKRDP